MLTDVRALCVYKSSVYQAEERFSLVMFVGVKIALPEIISAVQNCLCAAGSATDDVQRF